MFTPDKMNISTTSRACKEFVFIPQDKVDLVVKKKENDINTKEEENDRNVKGKSHRKVIILNDNSAMVVNESCLI